MQHNTRIFLLFAVSLAVTAILLLPALSGGFSLIYQQVLPRVTPKPEMEICGCPQAIPWQPGQTIALAHCECPSVRATWRRRIVSAEEAAPFYAAAILPLLFYFLYPFRKLKFTGSKKRRILIHLLVCAGGYLFFFLALPLALQL